MVLAAISTMLYALNRIWLLAAFPRVEFFSRYFGDLLALPVYVPLSFYLAWRLQLLPAEFRLKPSHVSGAALMFSVLFEGLIPLMDSTSFSDLGDVVAYFGGAVVVYLVGRMASYPMPAASGEPNLQDGSKYP